MKGTHPFDNNEIRLVSACFSGTYQVRNRSLFMLGVSTGGRISELLSLCIGDVFQNGKPVTDMLFDRSIVKGGEVSRAVPVNTDGRLAIEDLIRWHREQYRRLTPSRTLFPSRNSRKSLSRRAAHDMLQTAFESAGLNGKLATHSLRKFFAQRLYDETNDIFAGQEMLGHKNVATTLRYLGVNYADLRAAVERMATQLHRTDKTGDSFQFLGAELKSTPDETLFLELALRGYDLSKLRENDQEASPACEIVKIG